MGRTDKPLCLGKGLCMIRYNITNNTTFMPLSKNVQGNWRIILHSLDVSLYDLSILVVTLSVLDRVWFNFLVNDVLKKSRFTYLMFWIHHYTFYIFILLLNNHLNDLTVWNKTRGCVLKFMFYCNLQNITSSHFFINSFLNLYFYYHI